MKDASEAGSPKTLRVLTFSSVTKVTDVDSDFGSNQAVQPILVFGADSESKLPVRFQLQMHKFIWDPKQKGV